MTQGKWEIWIQIWKLKKWIQFNTFRQQVDDWMLLKVSFSFIQEDAFKQKKRNPVWINYSALTIQHFVERNYFKFFLSIAIS